MEPLSKYFEGDTNTEYFISLKAISYFLRNKRGFVDENVAYETKKNNSLSVQRQR